VSLTLGFRLEIRGDAKKKNLKDLRQANNKNVSS
jgi:hypothetical protein